MKEIFPSAMNSTFTNRNKRKLLWVSFGSVLIVTAIVAVVAGAASKNNSFSTPHHAIIKYSCSSTFYPELCFSAISSLPHAEISKVKTTKDVFGLSLNVTKDSVRKAYLKIKKISLGLKKVSALQVAAFGDCFELLNQTLVDINKVAKKLHKYPSVKSFVREHAEEFNIRLSASMTYQQTCIEGFSRNTADKKVRELFLADEEYVYRLCSIALALVKNITDTDIAKEKHSSEIKLKGEEDGIEWPNWMSEKRRRLLVADNLTPNAVVAADGTEKYKKVQDAVNDAKSGNANSPYIIQIKAGVYREYVEVPSNKEHIMFYGDGSKTTIITGHKTNNGADITTYKTATVAVKGDGFLARDIAFENSAGVNKNQSVALLVQSDQSAFYKCSFVAAQDTLYVYTKRQFYAKSVIIGTVDFIFGNGAVMIQDTDIRPRRPRDRQKNTITAQSRTDSNQNTGIVIQKSRISGTDDLVAVQDKVKTYLGRPWQDHSRVVVMQTDITDILDPAGWLEWDGDFGLDTLTYREYKNTGAGADTSKRVKWKGFKVITSESEAKSYTADNFIDGASWIPATGFPYSPGL